MSDQCPAGYPFPTDLWVSLSLFVQLSPVQYSDLRTEGLGLLGFSAISLPQGTDQGPSRHNWGHSGLVSSPGFLSLIGWYLPLSWKLLFCIFCLVFLIVSDRRVILVPIISLWPEAEGQARWYFIEYIWTLCRIIVTVFSAAVHAQLCPAVWTVACQFLCLWGYWGQNTGVDCYFLLRGSSYL